MAWLSCLTGPDEPASAPPTAGHLDLAHICSCIWNVLTISSLGSKERKRPSLCAWEVGLPETGVGGCEEGVSTSLRFSLPLLSSCSLLPSLRFKEPVVFTLERNSGEGLAA